MTTYDIREKISTQAKLIGKLFKAAIPVICFFLFLFSSILFIFGSKYIMVVPLITILFRLNYKKSQSMSSLLKICCMQLFMSFLAFVATVNLPLRIALNLVVPFWFIFMKSSQFNQLGYFTGLMAFTFLQLMPVDLHGFLLQMVVMIYALGCFLIIIFIYQRTYPQVPNYETEQRGLFLFANWLRELIKEEEVKEPREELLKCMQTLYQKAYLKRGNKEELARDEKIAYMFALLFQRAAYFIGSHYHIEMLKEEYTKEYISRVAAYIDKASKSNFWDKAEGRALKEEGEKLLEEIKELPGEIYMYLQNFFRLFLIILGNFEEKETQRKVGTWTKITSQPSRRKVFHQLKLDAFETRFALRMSVVLTLSFAYVVLMGADHGYWLPLNAFLLLRPMYEDSKYRMKTRFIGTALGCILLSLLLPILPGRAGHLILASIMGVCMYMAIPGTWIHTVFSTCYALSMTTLAMNQTMAIQLRLLYVVMAILVVLIVNKFFFQTSMMQQFKYNFQQVFHMHHVYLRILESSLSKPMNYSMICDAQMQYHLIHDQILQYINKQDTGEKEYYRKLLTVSWRMVSEMEQILFLVNRKRLGTQEVRILETYVSFTDYVLNEVQQMLNLKTEPNIRTIKEMNYKKQIKGELELSFMMSQYAKNLSRLYGMVCTHI